jgi:hypothetical protein
MSDVVHLLRAVEQGDPHAASQRLPLVYEDLRRLATHKLAQEQPGQTPAARVVELRYFTGAGHEAVASALGITVYQARQKWTYTRAWLQDALGE